MKEEDKERIYENLVQIKSYAEQIRKGAIRLHEKGHGIAEEFYTIADYFDKYAKDMESKKL